MQLNQHPMRFRREGRHLELELAQGRDICHLATLDEVLWVALSCPASGLECDRRTLELLDIDQDGRIRSREVRAAAAWLEAVVNDLSILEAGRAEVPLRVLRSDTVEGHAVAVAARRILANLGKADAERISLEDLGDRQRIESTVSSNGDGVIDAEATDDPAVACAIGAILRTTGGERDISGVNGIGKAQVQHFFDEYARFRKWTAEERALSDEQRAVLLPLGEETAAAFRALEAVEPVLDRFFAMSQLVAYDGAVAAALRPKPEALIADLDGAGKPGERLPVLPAMPNAEGRLPLLAGIHPAWREAFERFRRRAVVPLCGEGSETLDAAGWAEIKARFAPFRTRAAKRPALPFEGLTEEEAAALAEPAVRSEIEALIAADLAVGRELAAVGEVERLLHLARDFLKFCNNFVSLPDFYNPDRRAIFQAGELLIDGRRIRLCVWVDDLNQHAQIAQRSGIFTVYCEVRRKAAPGPRIIAAAVTAGTSGRIELAKNGIFYDRAGNDWEARVVRILAHSISLHEAVFAPFRKLGRMLSSQVEKLADNREQDMQRSVDSSFSEIDQSAALAAAEVPQRATAKASPAPEAPARSFGFGGVLAGGGFAIAAIGSSFAIIAERLKLVGTSGILYTVVVILLFLLIPSLIVAVIKLRGRDLGDVLEASGWAINGAIRLNFALSRRLTRRGVYPVSAICPPRQVSPRLLAVLAVLAATFVLGRWVFGWF